MAITKIPSKKYGFTYQVDVRIKDPFGVTQRHVKSGFKTQKEAKKYEANIISKADAKITIINEGKMSFDSVYKEYMEVEGVNKYAPATIVYYDKTHESYVKGKFGKTPISSIKYVNLQKYFNDMAQTYNYPTLKNIKKTFAVTFKYALKAGYIVENPVPNIMLKRRQDAEKVKPEIITDEDFERLIEEIQKPRRTDPRGASNASLLDKTYVIALYIGRYTGLRVSETLGLKKEDFDLENCTLKVQRRLEYARKLKNEMYLTDQLKSKSSKAEVAISHKLADILKEWFEENPYDLVICDKKGGLINPETLNMRIRTTCKSMGLHFHYHMLRHTYATELMMSGVNPIVVKNLLRHSEVNTTWNIYTHPTDEAQRNALDEVYGTSTEEHELLDGLNTQKM